MTARPSRLLVVACLTVVGLDKEITFHPAADPDSPARETVDVPCPRGSGAVTMVRVGGSATVVMVETYRTASGEARFVGRNFSHTGTDQAVSVEVRCLS